MPRGNDMVGGLRTDGIGGYHTVAQSGDEHRTVIRMRQQLAQQRAERLAGTRKRILLTADECIQLKREIAPLRLADPRGAASSERIAYLVYGEASSVRSDCRTCGRAAAVLWFSIASTARSVRKAMRNPSL